MKIKLTDYTMYEKAVENRKHKTDYDFVFEIYDQNLTDFPFLDSNVYISLKNIKKGCFFVADSTKKNIIELGNLSENDLLKMKTQKVITISILNPDNKYPKTYEFDVKKIK